MLTTAWRCSKAVQATTFSFAITKLSISTSPGCLTANGKQYDPFAGTAAGTGGGGTSTVIVDRNGRVVEDYLSLGGTIRNCAGGPTPWNSWITCEEDVTTPSSNARATLRTRLQLRGSVGARRGGRSDPARRDGPHESRGNLRRYAIGLCLDETEDRNDSVYYRFVPKKKPKGSAISTKVEISTRWS